MLGVDVHALGAVDLLHLADQVALGDRDGLQAQHLLGVHRALGEGVAGPDALAVGHEQALTARDGQ